MEELSSDERSGQIPTLFEIRRAQRRIEFYLRSTPLHHYENLSELLGANVFVKHENHLPTGAFKVRGGINLISQLNEDERSRGVIAASTGNHGQSVAYAARLFGVPATICVPENANPAKLESMRSLGAELVEHGPNYDSARERCEELAEQHGYRYIHSGNESQLIAGVGTYTLEIMEERPEIDTLFVPIGGGSGAAGACIAGKNMREDLTVIGVQSDAAPAAHESWTAQELREAPNKTFAEGLATGTPFELPQRIMWALLDDFILVSEEELAAATVTMIEKTRNLVEPAGAAAFAGALKVKDRLKDRTIAIVCSGGNLSLDQLRSLLA